MAKQRIDYVNRAGGLYGADAEEAARKRAQQQAQQQKNTVSADQAQSKTQSASAVRNTGRNLNTAQRDSAQAVEVFRNALETARKNYVKDPSESNAQSFSRSFSMLREAENNSRNVRENWDIWKENSEKKAQETRRRASEAYDKYFSSLNQKKEEQKQQYSTSNDESDMLSLDIGKARAEAYELRKSAKKDVQTYYDLYNARSSYLTGALPGQQDAYVANLESQMQAILDKYGAKDVNDIDKQLSQRDAYIERALRMQQAQSLGSVGVSGSDNFDPQFASYASQRKALPTKEILQEYDRNTDQSKWTTDAYGNIYDADGNRVDTSKRDSDGNIIHPLQNTVDTSDKLGIFRSASDEDIEEATGAYLNSGSTWDKIVAEGSQRNWNYMTDDEVNTYYYYLNKGGADAAERYLESIQETLNQRSGAAKAMQLQGKTGKELLYGFTAGADQFNSGMQGFRDNLLGKNQYRPVTDTQFASSYIREDLSDNGAKLPDSMGGASIAQIGYDAITNVSNMAPSILASTVVGALNPAVGSALGTGVVSASAAGNAYTKMENMGYSKQQARTYSALVGASEASLQYLLGGVSKLGGGTIGKGITNALSKADNALARFALQFGETKVGKVISNAASEGMEEYVQELLEPWFENVIAGTENEINPLSDEAIYSGLLGAITGGVFELFNKSGNQKTDLQQNQTTAAQTAQQDAAKQEASAQAQDQKPQAQTPEQKGAQRLESLMEDAKRMQNGTFGNPAVDEQENRVYDGKNEQGGYNNAEGLQETDGTGLPGRTGTGRVSGAYDGTLQVSGQAPGTVGQRAEVVQRGVQDQSGASDSGNDIRVPEIIRVSDSLREAQSKKGIQTYVVKDTSATPANYEQALNAGRNSDVQNGWCVTPKSAQELKDGNVRTFMNESGTVGLGIAPDGDIVAVFKNKNGGPKNALDTMMPIAIEQGGDRLDCYGLGLVGVYENYGFVPVARVEFNSEYANEGWTPDKGTPYIYVMMHNGDDAATVTEKMKTYHKSTDVELDALPTFGKDEYDSAMAYRDNLISQRSEGQNPSVGAADAGFTGYAQQYYDLLSDETAQRDRPGDVRPMEVPTKDPNGREVSEFVGNAFGAAVTSDRFVSTIQELVVEGALGHDIKSHKETLQEAAEYIKENSLTSVERKLTEAAMSGKATDRDIAAAMLLWADYNQSKSEERQQKAAELFVDLQQMATASARNLNLFNLVRKMTPQGQTQTVKIRVQRTVDTLNKGRSKKKQAEVTVPQELLDAHTKAVEAAFNENVKPDESPAVQEAEDNIYKYAASQIGSTMKEKWDAWRHMAMLGNWKTQVRNFGGNLFFKPFVTVKRAVGAAMERAMGVSQEERTKAVLGLGKDANLFRQLAAQDAKSQQAADLMSYSAKTGDTARNAISEYRAIFDYQADNDASKTPQAIKKAWEQVNKGLEFGRKGITNLMESADMIFKRWEYSASLATFLKARGYTAHQWQDGKVPENVLGQARAYAVQEAMKATFNDHNKVSDALSKLHYNGDETIWKVVDAAFNGIVPYIRTPANVAVRIAEYNPFSIIRAVWNGAKKVRSGQMSAATCIDQLASGLTGTGMVVLGYALASGIFGIRIIGGQVDEDDERMGYQKYSIVIGGESHTIGWAAPSVVPLFVGANLYQYFTDEESSNIPVFSKICTTFAITFEPMLELSCLSSLSDVIESVRYSKEGEGIYSAIASIATSYFMQGLPTLGAQLDQLGSETRQMVYADSEDLTTRQLQKTLGKISQRFPGDFFQTEYVDEWGRTQKTNVFESIFSPSYSKKIEETPMDLEISRLNDVQDENVSPKKPGYTVTVDGKTIRLSGEQHSELSKVQGQTAYSIVEQLIQTEQYQSLSDAEKAGAIKDAYAYAREYARVTCIDGYKDFSDPWMDGIEGKEAQAISQKALINSSGIGSEARYNRAVEMGYSTEQMRQVSAQVNQRLAVLENKTDYDTYRAVIDSVPNKELNKWLQVYGMSESRLEDLAKARRQGISPSSYVDYIEAKSAVESAVSALTSAWKDGTEEPLEELSEAYKAFSGISSTAISYYKENNGGNAKAFIDAMDAGVPVKTFSKLFKQFMELENSGEKPAVQADQWAAVLDKARSGGLINQKQRDILFADLGIFVTMRMDAKKYTELIDLGVSPDVALIIRETLADLSKKREKLDAISGADLSDEEKEASARAYLDDKEEEQLDAMLDLGFDVDTYAALYGIYSDESGVGKKARVKAEFMRDYGLTASQAEAVYKIFYGR